MGDNGKGPALQDLALRGLDCFGHGYACIIYRETCDQLVGKRGASVPPQVLLLLRTIIFQGLRRRLLLQGFRGVDWPQPGQRDGGRSEGDETLDAATGQGRKKQHGGGAAASWRHAFPRARLVAVPRGGEVESRGGEGGGQAQSMLGRLRASCTWREGRGGDERCYLGVNAMRQGHGHGQVSKSN